MFRKGFGKTKDKQDASPSLDRFHLRNSHVANSPMQNSNAASKLQIDQLDDGINYQEQFMLINQERQEMIRKFETEIKSLKSQLEAEKTKLQLANKLIEELAGEKEGTDKYISTTAATNSSCDMNINDPSLSEDKKVPDHSKNEILEMASENRNKILTSAIDESDMNVNKGKGLDVTLVETQMQASEGQNKENSDHSASSTIQKAKQEKPSQDGGKDTDIQVQEDDLEKGATRLGLLKRLTQENGNLSVKCKELENEITSVKDQLTSVKTALVRCTEENTSYKEMNEKDKSRIIALSEQNERLETELQTTQKLLDQSNATVKQLEAGGTEIARLNHEIQEYKAKIKALEDKAESDHSTYVKIAHELEASKSQCLSLLNEKEKNTLEKENKQGQIATLAGQLNETEQQRLKLENSLSELTDKYDMLRRESEKQKDEIQLLAKADTQLRTAKFQATQLKKELEDERSTIKVLTSSLSNLSQKFGASISVDKSVSGLTSLQKDQLISYYIFHGRAKVEEVLQMIQENSKEKTKKSAKDTFVQQAKIQRDILEETLMQNITLKTNLEAVSKEFGALLDKLGTGPEPTPGLPV